MAYIRKKAIKGKIYYSLVENTKKGIRTLESYGTSPPVKYRPQLIKGFAEEELKKIPDESVDLIIIDPPYGIDFDTRYRNEKEETIGTISLDNEKIFKTFPDVVRQCYRILKNNRALYCFSRWDVTERFRSILNKYFVIKNRLNWVKNNWSAGDLSGSYASQCEDIIFAVKGKHVLKEGRHTDFLHEKKKGEIKLFGRVGGKSLLHSHQKPIELLDFLIKKSSNRGDSILDCYAGSGSTIISAVNLGRKSIGIELNDKYLKIIEDRLEKECYSKVKGIDWKDTSMLKKEITSKIKISTTKHLN